MAPRILVLGAGGVGGYFGARLTEGGADTTFLLRSKRREQVDANGLTIHSDFFDDAHADVKTIVTDEIDAPFDLIILTCKAYQLDGAMDAIAPAVGAETGIIPLLNGMKQIDMLQARFGREKVLGGTTYIGARVDAETGNIVHFGDFHRIAYGEMDGSMSPRVDAFAALNDAVKFDIDPRDDIEQTMWDKFAMLCAMSSVNTLSRATVGEILDTPSGHEFLTAALAECRDTADALGHPVSQKTIETYERMFSTQGSKFASSMLRDVQADRPTEGAHIIGDMVERAEAAGLRTPILLAARAGLAVHDSRVAQKT
ncbi:MAG: 2-dehydropantoate 2-reductase [Alphaproteobacteria bacterium]|jgi:2-dehydropantoate 2-reductase|nr:2-dehydropantoate 2-reductase [Alphaproteobacteria bacterium]|tara:strand:+ start:1665 stop:2603 length:939 start_codon:yes stop_codon:yes gene_type:complete